MHSSIVARQQASNIHWQSIVNKLDDILNIMSENNVSKYITYQHSHHYGQVGISVAVELNFCWLPGPSCVHKKIFLSDILIHKCAAL